MALPLPASLLSALSDFIARRFGLHFPPERSADLQRALAAAADELGFDDIAACAEWLLSDRVTRAQLQVLVSHLTIGETYFFREKQTFEILADRILPALIRSRRGREQRLRLWSAACCTGEEAYSLAILVRQTVPDLADWRVTILGTDVNARFLRRAVAGVYGEWSFRDTPAGFKERHFDRNADGRYVVRPEIRDMVTFAPLNLVEDVFPALATDTNAMDVILCRNVLMYFTPEQTRKVVGNLHHALVDGGWLAVSPSEASQALFSQFTTWNFPGTILYRKTNDAARVQEAPMTAASAPWAEPAESDTSTAEALLTWRPPESPLRHRPESQDAPPAAADSQPPAVENPLAPYPLAVSLYEQGRYAEAAETLLALITQSKPEPPVFSLLARALANGGRLAEALTWCDRWLVADKLDSAGHYLRAIVLLECGEPEEARGSLLRAIYLRPDFVLAHFALGNLARSQGRSDEADRHFANALRLVNRLERSTALPESDGLTAGRLKETITALTSLAPTR